MENAKALKVLVYGATGTQAKPTVKHLLAQGHTAYVLTRTEEKAADLQAAGAELVVGDLSDPACLNAASEKVDAVAFLLPAFLDNSSAAVEYGRNAIDAAVHAGVGMFVWNTSGPLPQEQDSDDPKQQIFRYLQQSGLPYLLLEPTTYMENWLGPWTAPSVKEKNLLSYPVLEGRKMGWLACDDVGALVVAALERPELAGRRINISGVEALTGPELAEIFSRALASEIIYYPMAPEEMGAVLDTMFGPGSGDRIAEMYRKEQNDPNPEPNFHEMGPVLEVLPVTMTSIESWVTTHAREFN